MNEMTQVSRKRSGAKRTNKDLIEDRFEISKVVHIERSDDGDTIFGKAFDFSSLTIRHLKKQGRLDADIQLGLYQALKEVKDGTADSEAVKRMLKRARLSANREGIEG